MPNTATKQQSGSANALVPAGDSDNNAVQPMVHDVQVLNQAPGQLDSLSGAERAGLFLLAMGSEYGGPIWEQLDDDEVALIADAMTRVGNVSTTTMHELFAEFISRMSLSGAIMGNYETTERILAEYLPQERLKAIMEEIRGPAGRNMWEKLSNVDELTLANYLKNEYPQTVAVILSKIARDHASRVLTTLPDEFAIEVVQRMLTMETVQKEILEKIEMTLRSEFISTLSRSRQGDAHELMAEIFNNFDRQTETKFLSMLEQADREATEKIKSLMFTFDDLIKLDNSSAQMLMRGIEKDVLTLAIKGATEAMQEFFFNNMSERAGKMLRDDLEVMGPVRLVEVDEAQNAIVNIAKDLEAKGEIVIAMGNSEDQLVY